MLCTIGHVETASSISVIKSAWERCAETATRIILCYKSTYLREMLHTTSIMLCYRVNLTESCHIPLGALRQPQVSFCCKVNLREVLCSPGCAETATSIILCYIINLTERDVTHHWVCWDTASQGHHADHLPWQQWLTWLLLPAAEKTLLLTSCCTHPVDNHKVTENNSLCTGMCNVHNE